MFVIFDVLLQTTPSHTAERSYHSVTDFSTGVSTYSAAAGGGGPSPSSAAADNISLAASIGATSATSSTVDHHELINRYKNHTPEHDRPMYRKDILYTGSIQNLPQYNNNIGMFTEGSSFTRPYRMLNKSVHQRSH